MLLCKRFFTHSFMRLDSPWKIVLYMQDYVKDILELLAQSETYDMALRRLISAGFDVAAPGDMSTRFPIGRCWRLLCLCISVSFFVLTLSLSLTHTHDECRMYRQGTRCLVGCCWDVPGRMASLRWEPTSGELESAHSMLTIYDVPPEALNEVCDRF